MFSSSLFLFAFLPVVLVLYYIPFMRTKNRRNVLLFLASVVFYAWGEPVYVLLLLFSIVANWFIGYCIGNSVSQGLKKAMVAVACVVDIGILLVFKYTGFFFTNLNALTGANFSVPAIVLPIGISFFTFQAMSYVIDVYRGKGEAQKNPLNVGLYISLFPQLIAGPIVRYETVAAEIGSRQETREEYVNGCCRFIIGLAKKLLIADRVALIADACFDGVASGLSIGIAGAWIGLLAYTLQIYFDFSAYSDMAIGLGRIFGFHFEENFRQPYFSKSITEFWRRWHISLGTWFRDYVYIPLGGSRVESKTRHVFNLFVVWLLTGLWHGADWTFVIWGLMYFLLLLFEKYLPLSKVGAHRYISHAYTLFFVMMGWVVFRAVNINGALQYFRCLFIPGTHSGLPINMRYALVFVALGVAALFIPLAVQKLKKTRWYPVFSMAGYLTLLLFSLAAAINSTYSPFIYFNF